MSSIKRMTFIGMLNYDDTLFDNLTLPDGIDRETSILTFLLQYGECPSLYADIDFVKAALRVWSVKNAEPIRRINLALTASYNPIHNFDRYEEYTDTEDADTTKHGTGTNTMSRTGTNTTSMTGTESESTETETTIDHGQTTTNTISAYNSSTYQPDNQQEIDEDQTTSGEGSMTRTRNLQDQETRNLQDQETRNTTDTEALDRTLDHTGHLYGNIGVTKSQEMIRDEIELRETYSIYEIVANMLYKDFCIYSF